MNPLAQRIITAAVLVPLVLAALFLLPPRAFAIALLVVLFAVAHEWATLCTWSGPRRLAFVGVLGAAAIALLATSAAGFAQGWPDAVVVAVCGIATGFWLLVALPWVACRWQVRSPPVMALIGWVVLLGVWVALVQLQARSPWLALGAMAVVWIADTAAYFSGRAFGRRKLAPLVSPGKTWEGVAGAMAAVSLYALALTPLARAAGYGGPLDILAIGIWVALVIALAALSVVGDLYESWLKRCAGVKDSGRLLPGHGGVLDRIDAMMAAMPPAALAAQALLR